MNALPFILALIGAVVAAGASLLTKANTFSLGAVGTCLLWGVLAFVAVWIVLRLAKVGASR